MIVALAVAILAFAGALHVGEGYPTRTPDPLLFASSISFTNGEAGPITYGQAVYESAAATVKLAKSSGTDSEAEVIGFVAQATIASGAAGLIAITWGQVIPGLGAMTANQRVYLSTVAGALVTAVPTAVGGHNFLVMLGYSPSTTSLLYQPKPPIGIAA